MAMQGLRRLVRHGETWCEARYYLGLDFFEVLRGTLLEGADLSPFSGSFSKRRKTLVQFGAELNKRGKSFIDRLSRN